MNFDQFSIYSRISSLEVDNNQAYSDILKEIYEIKEYSTADDVMDYLQSRYGIGKNTNKFFISNNVQVNLNNNDNFLTIQISVSDREFLYHYNKRG